MALWISTTCIAITKSGKRCSRDYAYVMGKIGQVPARLCMQHRAISLRNGWSDLAMVDLYDPAWVQQQVQQGNQP